MATVEQIARISVLRGLGYQLDEIANEVGLSKSAVSYQLKKLKEKARDSSEEAISHLTKSISVLASPRTKYEGIPSGTRYVVTEEGVFLKTRPTGERLPVPDSDALRDLYLKFRGRSGRARVTDKGEILAYMNPDNLDDELDPEDTPELDGAYTNWYIIGTIKDDLGGKVPSVPLLPTDPSLYKPGDIWRGPVDGMRYSVGGKEIFRSHPNGPRWATKFKTKSGGLSKAVRLQFLDHRGASGGRFFITESNAVFTNVSVEDLDGDTMAQLADLNDVQRQNFYNRVEGTGMVPIFLGTHEGGIDLERKPSIHQALTQSQVDRLNAIFTSFGGEQE